MKHQSALGRRQDCRCLAFGKAAPAGPDARGMGFPIEPGHQHAGPWTGSWSPAALQAALLVLRLFNRKSSAAGEGQPQEPPASSPKMLRTQAALWQHQPTLTLALAGGPSPPQKAPQQNKPGGLDGTSSEYTNYRGIKAS